MAKKRILVVEDDRDINELIRYNLEREGFEVLSLFDGAQVVDIVTSRKPDLVLLDLMLPEVDGLEICRELKSDPLTQKTPIIMITAKGTESDMVIGLSIGADDYLPKPFLPRELILRVNRILKSKAPKENDQVAGVIFDRVRRVLKNRECEITLTVKEYDLLAYFFDHMDCAISRNDLLDHVWGTDYFGSERVIDDTLRRIRKKIPELPVETVYGFGYILRANL